MTIPTETKMSQASSELELQRAHLTEFANNIVFAQTLWRRYPQLVEAETLPKPLLVALQDREDAEPDYAIPIMGEEQAVKAGIVSRPRRFRFNRTAINEKVREALAEKGLEQIVASYAESATAEDLALVVALVDTSCDRAAIDVLNEVLICNREEEG